jgi:hypothetical protein
VQSNDRRRFTGKGQTSPARLDEAVRKYCRIRKDYAAAERAVPLSEVAQHYGYSKDNESSGYDSDNHRGYINSNQVSPFLECMSRLEQIYVHTADNVVSWHTDWTFP